MSRTLTTAFLLFSVWLLWSGHTEPLLLAFGVISVACVVLITRRMDRISGVEQSDWPRASFFLFLPWLVWQILKSNIDVARTILSRGLPISPRLVQVTSSQRTATGKVIHANSITLTPGTLSLDVRDDQILVHALTVASAEEVAAGEIDRRVTRIERGH